MVYSVRFFRAAFLALLVILLVQTSALAQDEGAVISLSPVHADPANPATKSYYVYATTPGREIRDEVRVRNTGTATGTVRLYAVDALTSHTSGSAFRRDKDPRQDVGAWVQLAEPELTLGPGEERLVSFIVTIPAGVRDGQHLGGLVAEDTAIKTGTGSGALQVNTGHRTIIAIQVNLPGPAVERVDVAGVAIDGSAGKQMLVLGLHNAGTEMVKPVGTISVTDAQGQEVQRLPFKLDTFVPDTAIQYPVAVQKQALGAGQYHAQVNLTYGASGVTSYEGDFTITAAQIAQVFPSTVAALVPPPASVNSAAAAPVAATSASAAPATTAVSQTLWPLFAGGAVLLVLAVAGGIFLGRRGRPADAAK